MTDRQGKNEFLKMFQNESKGKFSLQKGIVSHSASNNECIVMLKCHISRRLCIFYT